MWKPPYKMIPIHLVSSWLSKPTKTLLRGHCYKVDHEFQLQNITVPNPIGSMYGIYADIGGILMGSMLPYIAAPWILWEQSRGFTMFPLDVRSVICHNSAMSACGKAQQWQLALQLFAELGGEATAVSLNTAINACKSSSFLVCCNVVPPNVISWFINPINYSYKYHKP